MSKQPVGPKPMFEMSSPPEDALATQDRITSNFVFHHEHLGTQPTTIEVRFSRMLETIEQPYIRRMKVGEGWQDVNTAWIESASFFILHNHEPVYQVNPTPEQRVADQLKVIELAYPNSPPWLVVPGTPFVGSPLTLKGLRMRCQKGIAEVTLGVVPK